MIKRILDINYQLSRVFGEFIPNDSYHTLDNCDGGLYDIIFFHREGIQHVDFSEYEKYTHSNTKIVVDISTESGNIQEFLDDFKNTTDKYNYQFYLFVDSDLTNYLSKVNVKYKVFQSYKLPFHAFLNQYTDSRMNADYIIPQYENGFMSLNNSCRLHRVLLFTEFVKRNLPFDDCSFLFSTGDSGGYKFDKEIYEEQLLFLRDDNIISDELYQKTKLVNVPIIFDTDIAEERQYIPNEFNHYFKKVLNLVTENVAGLTHGDVSDYELITFTEKIIKPYLLRQIPLIYGLPQLNEVLRNLGFDLFDDLIDISFEKESDSVKRMRLIVDELERLSKLDLVKFREENKERFEHNYQNLFKLKESVHNDIKLFLYDELLK